MQTITINREDWSGGSEKVEILGNRGFEASFRLMGYTFHLKRRKDQEDPDCFTYCAEILGDGWNGSLGSVMQYYRDNYYTATGTGISRDDKDPIIAACKLLCNLI